MCQGEERRGPTAKSLLGRIGFGRRDSTDEARVPGGTFAAQIDQGLRRTSNQDQALATKLPDGAILLAVADGVGGAAGGDVAAALAIEEILGAFSRGVTGDVEALLREAFDRANRRVLQVGAEVPDLEGLASTLVVAVIIGSTARVAHAGDSRAYVYGDGVLEQVTNDHTWTAERVRAGQMTEDEAANSPFRHTITRGVGVAEGITPDVSPPIDLNEDGVVLLCSDGLYGPASSEEIVNALTAGPPTGAPARLIALANQNGGPDNISVAIYAAAPA